MSGQWMSNELGGSPHRIRPETHWFQETTLKGREDGRLWFSLQLTFDRADQLCKAFAGVGAPNEFAELLDKKVAGSKGEEKAVMMAPAGHAALCFAIAAAQADPEKKGANYDSAISSNAEKTEATLGTDILVHPEAFPELEKLWAGHVVEIADAGLAIGGDVADTPLEIVGAKSKPGAITDGSPIIIAIVDDGIGIANHRFRQEATGTRIRHFLDLALIGTPTQAGGTNELLGRGWTAAAIEKLLDRDEEQAYRALGLIDSADRLRQPLRAAVTHGTHMLDLAAGHDWRTESVKAARRPIIAVQLPTQVAENRSDTWLPQSLKRALDWILVKADELSAALSEPLAAGEKPRRLPLIVNGSFASMAGPQDGGSDVERRITQFVETYRGGGPEELCTFVLSAGNSLQLRAAARMDIPGEGVGEIPWRVLPDDKTPSFIQIWLPTVEGDSDKQPQQVEVSLVPPRDAPAAEHASELGRAVDWKIGNDVVARVYHQRLPKPGASRAGASRECITIAIRPTADEGEGAPLVPSGLWRVRVRNLGPQELRDVDLRVHRDDVGMFSRSGARQSYFDDPGYERFEPVTGRAANDERCDRHYGTRVTRQGTLSTYAYAKGVLAVGGYRNSDGEPAEYSSSGTYGKFRTKDADGNPLDGGDLAAASEESPALVGVLAAGTYSGSVAILNGTSVAAPQVTRALADIIAAGGSADSLKRAVAATEKSKSGPSNNRQLRNGVGRMPFQSSYRKRI